MGDCERLAIANPPSSVTSCVIRVSVSDLQQISKKVASPRFFRACDSLPIRPSNSRDVIYGTPAVFNAEHAGLVLHLNRVEIRRVWRIRCIRCIRYILSDRPCLSFGSLSGCVRLSLGCVPGCIRGSPGSISGCICLGLGSVPGCIRSGPGSVSGCIRFCARYASSSCGIPGCIRLSPGGVTGGIRSRFCCVPGCICISSSSVTGSIGIASLAASAASLSLSLALSCALPGPLFPAIPPWSASPRPGPPRPSPSWPSPP